MKTKVPTVSRAVPMSQRQPGAYASLLSTPIINVLAKPNFFEKPIIAIEGVIFHLFICRLCSASAPRIIQIYRHPNFVETVASPIESTHGLAVTFTFKGSTKVKRTSICLFGHSFQSKPSANLNSNLCTNIVITIIISSLAKFFPMQFVGP